MPLVDGVYGRLPDEEQIFFLSVVILNALRRVVLWKVVLRDVVYPCNTTLCFGGRDQEKLEKNTTSTFTNEIAELRIIKEICIKYNIVVYYANPCFRRLMINHLNHQMR